ncbi:enhancer of polycomb homolog 1-like isoform X2 [Artemia franciscana]|uniref:enhancer of polycomb homolog 1-like isoform X2 n=1 Tax=Artemia franciscana TaxID=6661 RepID=UPI0032DAE76C
MSKLSFRAKTLDSSKPLAIYHSKEVDISHINRIVPKMPTGMEKEEESEHHLQRALAAGQAIPVPEVFNVQDKDRYKRCYPDKVKMSRQLIHMQPFTMQGDIPEYDIDSSDEEWLSQQEGKLKITPLQFEDIIDKFERSCGTTAITLNDAKSILKGVDVSIVTAVYDYWLQKRITTQQSFIPQIKTDKGAGSNNNPYVAFRRRVERMTTRRNRKNDEVSYQRIVKLRRDLGRALDLLAMLKKREEAKKDFLKLGIDIFERRFEMEDFSGVLLSEAAKIASQKVSRTSFQPLTSANGTAISPASWEEKKRPYKRRKRQPETSPSVATPPGELIVQEEVPLEAEQKFRFIRTVNCDFLGPIPFGSFEEDTSRSRGGMVSLSSWTGKARRRIGRGGRVIYDRLHFDSLRPPYSPMPEEETNFEQYFRPRSPGIEEELGEIVEDTIIPKSVLIAAEDSDGWMQFDLDKTEEFISDFNLDPPLELEEDFPPVSSKWTRSSKGLEMDLKLPVTGDDLADDSSVSTSGDDVRLQMGNPVNEVF